MAKADGTLLLKVDLSRRRVLSIGRSPRCDLTLATSTVSRRHALLFRHARGWRIVDVGSRRGLVVESGPTRTAELDENNWVRIGNVHLWLDPSGAAPSVPLLPDPDETRLLLQPDSSEHPTLTLIDASDRPQRRIPLVDCDGLLVGSAIDCDVVVPEFDVAPIHAVIYRERGRWFVADGGSAQEPTLVLDGRRTRRHHLHAGAVLRVGQHRLIVSGPLPIPSDRYEEDASQASDAPDLEEAAPEGGAVSAFLEG